MVEPINSIGIIAGSKALPLLFAQEARRSGVNKIVVVAFEGETDPAIVSIVDKVVWLRVGQLSKLIKAFAEAGVTQCIMAGQIAPRNLFDVRPDLRAMAMLLKLKEKNAHTLFGGIIDELAKDGVEVVSAVPWLKAIMPQKGCTLGRTPSSQELEDADFGFRMAKEVSRLDIGQTVVVKEGTVLAVEGWEGTDPCLKRGGDLAGSKGGAVGVKVAKENHDFRFDIPCIGLGTLETCKAANIRTLAVEGGKTLFLEMDRLREEAKKSKFSLLTL